MMFLLAALGLFVFVYMPYRMSRWVGMKPGLALFSGVFWIVLGAWIVGILGGG